MVYSLLEKKPGHDRALNLPLHHVSVRKRSASGVWCKPNQRRRHTRWV